jgi:DNA-directed RNA polymerase subunit beta'
MIKDFKALKITVASAEDILNWSHGEVTKAETINYRTLKSEPQGLMAEEIFGPTKDFECYCGKYKKIRYKGIVCDRCGVEITHKRVRRERMGHIKLAAPVSHVWFSNGVPNKLSLMLDIPQKKLETVIYYARYVVTTVDEAERTKALDSIQTLQKEELEELGKELDAKIAEIRAQFDQDKSEAKKATKDSGKLAMQLERVTNTENTEIARIKSAYKQKQDNVEKKFYDLKNLVEDIKLGSTLSEDEYQLLDGYNFYFVEAGMGAEAIKKLLGLLNITDEINKLEDEFKTSKSEMKKARIIQRLRILKGIRKSNVNPSSVILDVLPVIPPDLRPIVQLPGGRFATYDLNDLYRRVINRNNRLKRLINLGAPEIILRNEKRMLQEAVDSLLDNNHKPGAPSLNSRGMPFKSLSDMLRGKQGRFRQNLLGKRVDYSGNAVIVPGPELQFNQCGLPKNIALEIFRPFIIRELIARGLAPNPSRAKVIFEQKDDEVFDILEEVSKDRPVLLNRAPTLHRQSILAFYPILIEGNAIRLHPMTCTGFNADFDGDQMAVHLPLSDKAVEEVQARMFAKENMLNLRDGSPIVNVAKDMAFGIYFLTSIKGDESNPKGFYPNVEALISDYNLRNLQFFDPAKVLLDGEVITTSPGRAIFNQALPEDYPYVNKALNKFDIADLSSDLFNKYGSDEAILALDEIKRLGFKYGGQFGFSISMSEFQFGGQEVVEKELANYDNTEEMLINDYYDGFITDNELRWKKRDSWVEQSEKIQGKVWDLAKQKSGNLMDLDKSGATSVSSWVKKISGVFGYVTDPSGNVVDLPIKNNFEKGLTSFEYFVSARGSRKSFADVALRTADSGYLTRRLHDVAQDVITTEEDCGSTEGVKLLRSEQRLQPFGNRIRGRILSQNVVNPKSGEVVAKKGEVVTIELAEKINSIEDVTEVEVRSPMTCNVSHGVCINCYGFDNGTGKMVKIGEAVGTIASQALGEPTTQLTLKSKSDARAAKADVTQGLPRVEELLEARNPKAQAILAEVPGVVTIIDDKKSIIVRVTSEAKVTKRYEMPTEYEIVVKKGATVKEGEVIAMKGKKEIKSEIAGKVNIEDNAVIIEGSKHIEIDKETELLVNVMVKDGQHVERGDQLTYGSVDPKELAELKSIYAGQKYIVQGVQDVYGIQGLEADDRHLEVITRQMCRYGLIKDSGDSELFLPGDYVDVLDVEKENRRLEKEGKKIAKYHRVLMGITNAAIRTESFLSAASFEQQVRVLTDAALIGKVDNLRGLKENVIIGRPVPLGEELLKRMRLEAENKE